MCIWYIVKSVQSNTRPPLMMYCDEKEIAVQWDGLIPGTDPRVSRSWTVTKRAVEAKSLDLYLRLSSMKKLDKEQFIARYPNNEFVGVMDDMFHSIVGPSS